MSLTGENWALACDVIGRRKADLAGAQLNEEPGADRRAGGRSSSVCWQVCADIGGSQVVDQCRPQHIREARNRHWRPMQLLTQWLTLKPLSKPAMDTLPLLALLVQLTP